jgi:Flp pilus assembly protein TadG
MPEDPRARSSARRSRHRSRGQSLVEFALILPIFLLILLGIADVARVYTTMLTVESAAREAADYGALYPWHWDPTFQSVTVTEMERRACVAASALTDYAGDATTCTNPTFSHVLHTQGHADCSAVARTDPNPCQIEVTLAYDFSLLVPTPLLGLPSTLSFERSSLFEISDFEIDPGAPTPTP